MDSSSLQRASSVSSNRENEKEASALIQSRRAKFFSTYQRQSFSLPNSIMFYMAKNPTSPEVYEKMIQSCKYFYVKNPILVIPVLTYCGDGKWEFSDGKYYHISRKLLFDLSKITSKLWITDRLLVQLVNTNILSSSLMPKFYRCEAKSVFLFNQIIFFHDLSLLVSSAEDIDFYDITVKDENDSNVGIEKIVEVAVKAKRIDIEFDIPLSLITAETMKKLIKLPHFLKLDEFDLKGIPDTFDLETFYSYIKKNKCTKFSLEFDDSISEAFKNRLKEIVDEILAAETFDYKSPCIYFAGLDEAKGEKLLCIFYSHH